VSEGSTGDEKEKTEEGEKEVKLQIERYDGTVEKRTYKDLKAMLKDAAREAKHPLTKRLTLSFPKKTIPKGRRKK